jgi:AhpD family alkylhydroperoxidase
MRILSTISTAALGLQAAFEYTQEDRDDVNKYYTEDLGFPVMEAMNMMTPKMITTMMTFHIKTLTEGSFEFFEPREIDVIYAAVSAYNNCESCIAFHAIALKDAGTLTKDDINEMMEGGLPQNPTMRPLAIGAKYALAHKGILLPRETMHMATMGIEGEKLTELVFLSGFINGLNMLTNHLISQGLELEEFLQEAGPFADGLQERPNQTYCHCLDEIFQLTASMHD